MNGLGAVFLSLFGVDASRVLVPCEHILEGSEHMIDNNRPALPARTRTTSAPAGRTLPTRIRYSAVAVGATIAVTAFVVARMIIHVPPRFTPLAVMLTLIVSLTTTITRYINADRPPHFPCSSRHGTTWWYHDRLRPGQSAPAPRQDASRPAVLDLSTTEDRR